MAAIRQGQGRPAGGAASLVVDERFLVQPEARLADFGGLSCFQAEDRRGLAGPVVALRALAAAPPRAKLNAHQAAHHEALISPLAHGAAGSAYWIITTPPPGPSLASLAVPWSGNGLLTHVLRPAAQALDHLQSLGLTHRAIRPDNLFVAPGGKAVVLGPAWGAPSAMQQPALFEPPYSAMCAPAARGDGSIADDVYALGVVLLALLAGEAPMAGLEAREILQLKLEYGSHAALVGQLRLQRGFEEILRAMLSDDPLARPVPEVLANLDGIHARRGGQRTVLRASRPIALGDRTAWNRRTLALLCAERPAEAMLLLRQAGMEHWLRRALEDAAAAAEIEELRRDMPPAGPQAAARGPGGGPAGVPSGYADDLCLMRLVALLDPLAPLFWRGTWLWPDGIGPLLAAAVLQPPAGDPRDAASLVEALLVRGAVSRWRWQRAGRSDPEGPALPARLLRRTEQDDEQAVLLRVAYALNPYLACASPQLVAEAAIHPAAVIAALERLTPAPAAKSLLDAHMLAFLDARMDEAKAGAPEPNVGGDADPALRELSILARWQAQSRSGPLTRIAGRLLPRLEPKLADWPGLSRRQQRLEMLRGLAASGDLAGMARLVCDAAARRQDEAAREQAVEQAARIVAALAEHGRSAEDRLGAGRQAARDTASAIGLLCIMAALLYELLV